MYRSAFLLLFLLPLWACKPIKQASVFISNEGFIYGTVYHLTYESPEGKNLQAEVEEALKKLDLSLSTFNRESVLARVNRNETVNIDEHFIRVFSTAREMAELSGGAFDPTVAPLVNAWGFGFTKKENVTQALIDSIVQFVGYKKVYLTGDTLIKEDSRVMLDFSAIAKGYTVDRIGELLNGMGCRNYMVEIGGEVIAKGVNPNGMIWRIGINEPNEDEPAVPKQLQAIVALNNKALATSGNYRNFYIEGGQKFAHTIDPFTGYPVRHNLLSATVLADDCMTADALATACMVKGVEKAMGMASIINGIDFFFIYADSTGEHQILYTDGFRHYLTE